jgi:hypothetical protein
VIEARAKYPKDPYGRRIIRVRKDSLVIAAVDYYNRQNRPLKNLRVSSISQIDGIWTAAKMKMTNVQNNHTTVIEMPEIQFNLPLDDGLFAVTNLERGNLGVPGGIILTDVVCPQNLSAYAGLDFSGRRLPVDGIRLRYTAHYS